MILTSITIIATTSNIWIKPPTIPSKNPNSHRINRIVTIVQNIFINLTSSWIIFILSANNIFACFYLSVNFTTFFSFYLFLIFPCPVCSSFVLYDSDIFYASVDTFARISNIWARSYQTSKTQFKYGKNWF